MSASLGRLAISVKDSKWEDMRANVVSPRASNESMEVDTALLDRMAPPSLDFNADWTCPKILLHVLMLCEAPPSGATYSLTARRNVVPPRSHPHPIADGGRGRGTNRSRSQSLRGGRGSVGGTALRAGDPSG